MHPSYLSPQQPARRRNRSRPATRGAAFSIQVPMKLRELMIFVSDLGRAKAFYRDVLGFGLVSEGGGHVVFSYANGTLTVYPCEKDGSPGDYANEARSVFVFEVASIDAVMADLQRQGVRFLHATPAQNEAGRYAAFVDPFGNVHELFEAHAA